MKNLQNYGVQELNAKEMKTTDGGIIPLALLGLYVADALILGKIPSEKIPNIKYCPWKNSVNNWKVELFRNVLYK